jgi:hypothetical protein
MEDKGTVQAGAPMTVQDEERQALRLPPFWTTAGAGKIGTRTSETKTASPKMAVTDHFEVLRKGVKDCCLL